MDRSGIIALADQLAQVLMPLEAEWPHPEVVGVGPGADGQKKTYLIVTLSKPIDDIPFREFEDVEVLWKVMGEANAL